jgi:hypothetical protein
MATFQGKVSQDGWSVEVTTEDGSNESTLTVESLAITFIQSQTTLQAEGQKFIRESFSQIGQIERPETFTNANGQAIPEDAEEAETISS